MNEANIQDFENFKQPIKEIICAYTDHVPKLSMQVFATEANFKKYNSNLSEMLKKFDPDEYFCFDISDPKLVKMIENNFNFENDHITSETDKKIIRINKVSVLVQICLIHLIGQILNIYLDATCRMLNIYLI